MIKNQKQAGITRVKIEELRKAKAEMEFQKSKIDPAKYDLGIKAFNSLITELEGELSLYNSLIEGNFNCLHVKSLEDIPKVLIAARLAQKLSHEDLGKMLGWNGQQIQRYEATDYETSSWVRIVEIALKLNLKFGFDEIFINSSDAERKFKLPTNVTPENCLSIENKTKKSCSLMFLNN